MEKDIVFGLQTRQGMKAGVDKLANAVKATLGPKGRNVIISHKYSMPTVTKDGVTVAKSIDLKDPLEQMGSVLVKSVASKTNDVAGDGTTTACVLAQALIHEGMNVLATGADAQGLRKGIEAATKVVVAEIKAARVPVAGDAVEHIASISANDPELGKMIADAMKKVGENGVITVEEGNNLEIEVEVVEGMRLDKGFVSPYFVTNAEKGESEVKDALVILSEQSIRSTAELVPFMERAMKAGHKSFFFITGGLEGEALATLVGNHLRGIIQVTAIQAPGFGDRRKEILGDIAAVVGASVVSEDKGQKFENLQITDCGSARRIVVTKDTATLVEGGGDSALIATRIAQLRTELEATEGEYQKNILVERIASLAGGVGIIKVGAASEVELREVKHRIEDAVAATKAAVEEGVVIGGGTLLLACQAGVRVAASAAKSDAERLGYEVVARALEAPLRQIALNAGKEPGVVLAKVLSLPPTEGWNAATDTYGPLIPQGVIDPAKVVRSALENASSVAVMLLTTEAAVFDSPEEGKVPEVDKFKERYGV